MTPQRELDHNFLAAKLAIHSVAEDPRVPIHERVDRLRELCQHAGILADQLDDEDLRAALRGRP
jgi:hypothetical protein